MCYIDAHTHKIDPAADHAGLLDAPVMEALPEAPPGWKLSSGIHPWNPVDADAMPKAFAELRRRAEGGMLAAIGECGLDRLRGGKLPFQLEILTRQLELAGELKLPCVIHCVRAIPELLMIRKRFRSVPWIIHGFSGNTAQMTELIRHDCHLSFGSALVSSQQAEKVLKMTPPERILLESDAFGMDITAIYARAAQVLGMDMEALRGLIRENFTGIFG